MLHERWQRNREWPRQLADARGALAESPNHRPTRGIRKRDEEPVKFGVILIHKAKYCIPATVSARANCCATRAPAASSRKRRTRTRAASSGSCSKQHARQSRAACSLPGRTNPLLSVVAVGDRDGAAVIDSVGKYRQHCGVGRALMTTCHTSRKSSTCSRFETLRILEPRQSLLTGLGRGVDAGPPCHPPPASGSNALLLPGRFPRTGRFVLLPSSIAAPPLYTALANHTTEWSESP